MATEKGLFEKYNQCEFCNRPLPAHYEQKLCPKCLDTKLFRDVKEFIRSNNVNEYEVAEHFSIPLKQVKGWIREGRIEYQDADSAKNITSVTCQRCGAPVSFGTLCPKCLKLLNGKGSAVNTESVSDSRMHYLDQGNSQQTH